MEKENNLSISNKNENNNETQELSIEELDKKISELKSNLTQVSLINESEKQTKSTKEQADLLKLQKDLQRTIKQYEDFKKYKILDTDTIFNETPLKKTDITRICLTFHNSQWLSAMINNLDEEKQTADLTIFKTKDIISNNFKNIKKIPKVNKENIFPGALVTALFYEDGEFYSAIVDQITDLGIHVKYRDYEDSKEIVSFDSIRISQDEAAYNERIREKGAEGREKPGDEFKLPEFLKVLPTDSEEQRLIKRKRAKGLKYKHKQKIIEEVVKEKQDSWLAFNQKSKYKGSGLSGVKKEEKSGNNYGGFVPFKKGNK